MSIGRALWAAAVTTLGFVALPAVASAYTVDYPGEGKFTVASTAEKSTILKAGGTQVSCTSVSGEGEFFSPHGGGIELIFHGCKSAGTNCTTTGSPAGTITTTRLPFHVVEVTDPAEVGHPGVLITPGSGEKPHFASFQCASGLVSVTVDGNGVVGTLTFPGCNERSKFFSFAFEENGFGGQTHTTAHDTTEQVDSQAHFQLEATINGGKATPAALIGTGTIDFTEGEGELTCPE